MNVFFDRLSLMPIGWLPLEFLPHIQRIRHTIILVCLRMLRFLQSVFQSPQLFRWKIPTLNRTDDCLHHILTNIVGTVHVIEIIVMLVFHKVVSKAFEHFEQDGYDFGIVALA